jgi:hypothetical protein
MKSKLNYKAAREKIKASGRSIVWLSNKIGIKPNTLSQYLMGNSQPSMRVIIELSRLTDCNVTDLLIGNINENIYKTSVQKKGKK